MTVWPSKAPPAWLWICIAYLLLSVAYNVWKIAPFFQFLLASDSAFIGFVGINLLCNLGAAVAFVLGRKIGVYFLFVGFLDGLIGETWSLIETYRMGFVPPVAMTLISFLVSLVIIFYTAILARRHVLQ